MIHLPKNLRAGMYPPFVGDNAPNSYITVQTSPTWWLTSTNSPRPGALGGGDDTNVGINPSPGMLPYRFFIDQANTINEVSVPNLKSVVYDDQIANDAPTLTVSIFNLDTTAYGDAPLPGIEQVFGDPGAMSFTYGATQTNTDLWGQVSGEDSWNNILREGALLRWYFGYGGLGLTQAEAFDNNDQHGNAYVVKKGLFTVDNVQIDANTGIITLTCRGTGGKCMLDSSVYPDLVSAKFYTSTGIQFNKPSYFAYLAHPGYGAVDVKGHPVGNNGAVGKRSKEGFAKQITDMAVDPNDLGYCVAGTDGGTFSYNAGGFGYGGISATDPSGAPPGVALSPMRAQVVAICATKLGAGYWLVDRVGNVAPYGNANPFTDPPDFTGAYEAAGLLYGYHNIVVAASSASGAGLWAMDSAGHVFGVGDVALAASGWTVPAVAVGVTFVGFSPNPNTQDFPNAFVVLDSAGGVHGHGMPSYGNYTFPGHATAIEMTNDGLGYWIVGNANLYGVVGVPTNFTVYVQPCGSAPTYISKDPAFSLGFSLLAAPICKLRRSPQGSSNPGFWLLGEDGGIFTFGEEFFYGAIPANYTLWTPSNYVSPYNTGGYIPIPDNVVPPVNATITTYDPATHTSSSKIGGPGAAPLLAPDYCQVIRWLWLISGGYYPPAMAFNLDTGTYYVSEYPPINQPPPILGCIYDSLAYDALGPIDPSTLDKVPPMQAANSLLTAIGYIKRWRDDGGLYAGIPNIFLPGNFMEDDDYKPWPGSYPELAGPRAIPLFEAPLINDYQLTSTDQSVRSVILVGALDPYLFENTPSFPTSTALPSGTSITITRVTPPATTLDVLHGLPKPAMIGVPLNVPISPSDQDLMGEFQLMQCWLAIRQGQLQSVYDPEITTDCQIQIYERVTGETNVQYVTGVHVEHDCDTGECLATYTVQWLGDNGTDGVWAIGGAVNNQSFDAYGNLKANRSFTLSKNMIAQLIKGKSPPAIFLNLETEPSNSAISPSAATIPTPPPSYPGYGYLPPPPSAPVAPTISGSSSTADSVTLNWVAPISTPATITGYDIYMGTTKGGESGTPVLTVGDVLTGTVTGLSVKTVYYFTVEALSTSGNGPASNEQAVSTLSSSVSPSATPPILRGLSSTRTSVTVNWDAPNYTPDPITNYDIYMGTISSGIGTSPVLTVGNVLTGTVTGLTPNTEYMFTVEAVSSAGHSPASAEGAIYTSSNLPGAPFNVSATPGNAQVTVHWTPPTSDGGSTIQEYNIYISENPNVTEYTTGQLIGAAVPPYTSYDWVIGLFNGTTYYFGVAASNANGLGPISAIVHATPRG